jgi:hypothetical protein
VISVTRDPLNIAYLDASCENVYLCEYELVAEVKNLTKLRAFNPILPPLYHRRGLINFGGQALKLIFGTATISDAHELHKGFENLRERNDDIAHSLANQLTYVMELRTVTAVNTDSIGNLSNILRDSLVQSHDQDQQILRDII